MDLDLNYSPQLYYLNYMRLPSPHELGLPPKYTSWRPVQEDALRKLLASTKRTKVVSAPVGSGKTGVVITYALLTKRPTCIVTESRGLQDQYMEDGRGCGMVDIRGRGNYECHMRQDYTCEEGAVARCPYKGSVACPYSAAEMRAATSPLVVTNYAKWTSSRKFGKGMDHFTQVIFDEGHEAVNAVGRAMQVTLHHREIEETLGLDFPAFPDCEDLTVWKGWASTARAVAELKMLQMQHKLAGVTDPKPSWVRHYTHMRLLTRRLAVLALAKPADWVVEESPKGFIFDPIRPGRYTEMALFLRIPSVVCISATIRPKTLYLLGQAKGSFDYWEFESDFDPHRCPIYYLPVLRVDYRTDDLSAVWLKLDQIAARRTDRKGLVQTISFVRRDEVKTHSRFSSSMLINPQGEAPTEVLDQFYAAGPGTILVSPSVGSGYDFAFTKAEWQFVCKIPFPPPSKILKARTEEDREYPYYLAWNKLAQIFGRIMRDKADRGESFIVDKHLDWFRRYSYLAPKTFKLFLKEVDHVPPPPPKL
jgi:Rad3-related DNA helicase